MKRLLSKLVPEVPILVAATLLVTMPSLRGTATGLATLFPFAVVAAALLLGWRFNRSRLVFAIALLALTEYLLLKGVQTPRDRLYFHVMTFLLPINLALVALLPERGTITPAGLLRWAVAAGVATIPLSPFYAVPPSLSVLRLCVAKQDSTLDEAAKRLNEFAARL